MTLTKYSTNETCPSSDLIIYCMERKPRLSVRIDTREEIIRAFTDGFKREILYLEHNKGEGEGVM